MAMWYPWRGCKKCSDGCLYCYIHKGDFKRNVDTSNIVKPKDFEKPIEKLKNGNYKMKSGLVYTCFSTDFFIEEADEWKKECWKINSGVYWFTDIIGGILISSFLLKLFYSILNLNKKID